MEKTTQRAEMAIKTPKGLSNKDTMGDLLGKEPDVRFTSVIAATAEGLPQSVIDRLKWGG